MHNFHFLFHNLSPQSPPQFDTISAELLEQPSQVSVQDSCGGFLSLKLNSQSLFPLDCEIKSVVATVSVQLYLSFLMATTWHMPTPGSRKTSMTEQGRNLFAAVLRQLLNASEFGIPCTAGKLGCCRGCRSDCAPDPSNWRSRRAWAHNLCLGRNRSGDQTPSSDRRVRMGFDTVRLGSDVEALDEEALGEERTGTERTWRWATTSKTQDENARAGWLWMTRTQLYLEPRSEQCVLTRKSVLCTLQEVYSVCTR